MSGCIAAVESFTRGSAAAVIEADVAPARTGTTDDEWWHGRAQLLDARIEGRFPRLHALAKAGAFSVSDATEPYTVQRALDRFAFGLNLLLDSIAARLDA